MFREKPVPLVDLTLSDPSKVALDSAVEWQTHGFVSGRLDAVRIELGPVPLHEIEGGLAQSSRRGEE